MNTFFVVHFFLLLCCHNLQYSSEPKIKLVDKLTNHEVNFYGDTLRVSEYHNSPIVSVSILGTTNKSEIDILNYFLIKIDVCFNKNDLKEWVGEKKVFGSAYSTFYSIFCHDGYKKYGFQSKENKDFNYLKFTHYNRGKNLISGHIEIDMCEYGTKQDTIQADIPSGYLCFQSASRSIITYEQLNTRRIYVEFSNFPIKFEK